MLGQLCRPGARQGAEHLEKASQSPASQRTPVKRNEVVGSSPSRKLSMARVPYLDPADLAPQNRDLLARNINLYRALAHSPDAARNFMNVGRYIRYHSRLDPRLREMAILQVGYVTRSPYEYSHHIKIGRDFGVT